MRTPYTPDTQGKTETFFTRNVRLITFLICITVFLGIFGPLSVFHIVRHFNEIKEEASYTEMTVEDLRVLLKRADTLTEKDITRYAHDDGGDWKVADKTGRMYYIQLGERFQLSCMVELQTKSVVYLSLFDSDLNESFDLLDKKTDIDKILGE